MTENDDNEQIKVTDNRNFDCTVLMGQDEAEVYCQKFRKWSVLTQWNECALAAIFRKGLSEALKDAMVGFPTPAGLNESMSLAIQIDRRMPTASNPVSSHRSSVMLCPTTKKPIIRPSVCTSVLKSSIASIKNEPDDASVKEPQLDCTTATTTTTTTTTTERVVTGPTKVQSHCSMSEFGKDQPPSRCLFLSEEEDSKFDPAANKPRIGDLNLPTSTSHRHAAAGISFGGKENMQISELIAEVAKFADTKPVLKGIDINQVVQILIRNRNEKTRNKSQDSTE
ncbi:unnamed protein product [Ranitomeya imitator]|uniref:Uncharacterized protein n=1 Tax=Ranitomeya imitator TaxID=111125 RepID=A0ABN9M2W8_9NEOB|nr:unnamed protein product [Ranitomeya imitator]